MTHFGGGVEGAPRPITTAERSSVSTPIELDILQLQGEKYHKGGNGDAQENAEAVTLGQSKRSARPD